MISYEELCAALDRYRARKAGVQVDEPVQAIDEYQQLPDSDLSPLSSEESLDAGDILSDEPGSN